jgi:hypothetical protein
MPENFTSQEWEEYLDKIRYLKPMNDMEWKEYSNMLKLGRQNPNYEFYPRSIPKPIAYTPGYTPVKLTILDYCSCITCCFVLVLLITGFCFLMYFYIRHELGV